MVGIGLAALCMAMPAASVAGDLPDEMKFEISILAGLQRYLPLLARPGYAAVVLESNGMGPSASGKLIVKERGRAFEASNVLIRFREQKGAVYHYEAGIWALGSSESRLALPVRVDLSDLTSGRATVAMGSPLVALVPDDLKDRIQYKMQAFANPGSQKKIVDYLDGLAKEAGDDAPALFEAILRDAYNRSSAPGSSGRDVGDALPVSDQFLLLFTVAIWLVAVPVALLVRRAARRRAARGTGPGRGA